MGEGTETRKRILETVAGKPGLHVRELARELDVHHSLIDYHLRELMKAGLVNEVQDEGYKRYHMAYEESRRSGRATYSAEERRWISVLRRGRNVEIATVILLEPGMTLTQLHERTVLSISTLSAHVKRMERSGLLTSQREGKEKRLYISMPSEVSRLILAESWKHQDMVDSFREVWEGLGA